MVVQTRLSNFARIVKHCDASASWHYYIGVQLHVEDLSMGKLTPDQTCFQTALAAGAAQQRLPGS